MKNQAGGFYYLDEEYLEYLRNPEIGNLPINDFNCLETAALKYQKIHVITIMW